MSNLILQTYYHDEQTKVDHSAGCYLPCDELAVESEFRFRLYAKSIGADYKMIDAPPFKEVTSPAWARFCILWETEYDNVCYIDADILPTRSVLGHSIFEHDGVGKLTERDEGSKHSWHVNAGVFKLTRRECYAMQRFVFASKHLRWLRDTGKNQDPFNEMYKKAMQGRKPKPLDPRWNMTRPYHRPGYFAHYIGHQKTKQGNGFGSMYDCPIYNEDWSFGETAQLHWQLRKAGLWHLDDITLARMFCSNPDVVARVREKLT